MWKYSVCHSHFDQPPSHRADQTLTGFTAAFQHPCGASSCDSAHQTLNGMKNKEAGRERGREGEGVKGDPGLRSAVKKRKVRVKRHNKKDIKVCAGMFPVLARLSVCHPVCASASSRALIMRPRLCAHTHTCMHTQENSVPHISNTVPHSSAD